MKHIYTIPQITPNRVELQSTILAGSAVTGGLLMGGNTKDTGSIPYGD